MSGRLFIGDLGSFSFTLGVRSFFYAVELGLVGRVLVALAIAFLAGLLAQFEAGSSSASKIPWSTLGVLGVTLGFRSAFEALSNSADGHDVTLSIIAACAVSAVSECFRTSHPGEIPTELEESLARFSTYLHFIAIQRLSNYAIPPADERIGALTMFAAYCLFVEFIRPTDSRNEQQT